MIKKINIDLLLIALLSVIVVILLLKLYKYKTRLIECIDANTELATYIEASPRSDSLVFSYLNRYIPYGFTLRTSNEFKKTIDEISKKSLFIYLSNIDCGPCVTDKVNILLSESAGLTESNINIFVKNINPRELSLFTTVTDLPPSSIYVIENDDSLFANVVNSFIFTISSDNRIQNLRDFNNMSEMDLENYAKAFCKSIEEPMPICAR